MLEAKTVDVSGRVDGSVGVEVGITGVLDCSAGVLDCCAGVLDCTAGLLDCCAGVLDCTAGVLVPVHQLILDFKACESLKGSQTIAFTQTPSLHADCLL